MQGADREEAHLIVQPVGSVFQCALRRFRIPLGLHRITMTADS